VGRMAARLGWTGMFVAPITIYAHQASQRWMAVQTQSVSNTTTNHQDARDEQTGGKPKSRSSRQYRFSVHKYSTTPSSSSPSATCCSRTLLLPLFGPAISDARPGLTIAN
jgi:hypothetical protein